jgi:hypothetical protein
MYSLCWARTDSSSSSEASSVGVDRGREREKEMKGDEREGGREGRREGRREKGKVSIIHQGEGERRAREREDELIKAQVPRGLGTANHCFPSRVLRIISVAFLRRGPSKSS